MEKERIYPYTSNYGDIEDFIKEKNYTPETTLSNLVVISCAVFESHCEDRKLDFYNDKYRIDIQLFDEFIELSGGLKEFDIWA